MDAFTTGVDTETGGADYKNPWGALNVAFGCFLPKVTFEALRLQPLIFEVGILSILFVCWVQPNLFCYFWLDPKVTKRSRPNLASYFVSFVRCRV